MRVLLVIAMLVASLGLALSANAQPARGGPTFGVQLGSGNACHGVIDQMRREWSDIRMAIAPDHGIARPSGRDFMCVSPEHSLNAMPKPVPALTSLKCYQSQGLIFCCDRRRTQCATL